MAAVKTSKGTERPILVTGTYRSGTTWIGDMLAFSPRVHYVHEPFAGMYERSWVRRPPTIRMYHERSDCPGVYREDLERIVGLRPPWLTIARRSGRPRHVLRVGQEALRTTVARRRGARALIKDPFSLLLAEWIAATVDAHVVVAVRHPAAFASSVKRLGWRFDTSWLLSQPALMEGDLAPFRRDLEIAQQGEHDIIDNAILMWRVLNSVVNRYDEDHPDWSVLRYEDLAADPLTRFASLFERLEVPWSKAVARRVAGANSASQAAEVPDGSRGGTRRDSRRAMRTWKDRLTNIEVERVREGTSDIADRWYAAADWCV